MGRNNLLQIGVLGSQGIDGAVPACYGLLEIGVLSPQRTDGAVPRGHSLLETRVLSPQRTDGTFPRGYGLLETRVLSPQRTDGTFPRGYGLLETRVLSPQRTDDFFVIPRRLSLIWTLTFKGGNGLIFSSNRLFQSLILSLQIRNGVCILPVYRLYLRPVGKACGL